MNSSPSRSFDSNSIKPLLDAAVAEFSRPSQRSQQLLPELNLALDEVRKSMSASDWAGFCSTDLARHPIAAIFLQDPFTRHSYTRPRGYPGDADLLDYIYGHKSPTGATPVGLQVFEYSSNVQSCVAVRERRIVVGSLIDRIAAVHPDARVLSLAAGHCREVEISQALRDHRISELVAFDQDAESLASITQAYGNGRIKTKHGLVRSLFSAKHGFEGFHLVYAAGLFDYLPVRAAKRLVRAMFDMLLPGGTLMIANFAPTVQSIGYMEAFMRWMLIYRDEIEMASLTADIPLAQVKHQRIYSDSNKCMFFLEVERA